MKKTLLLFTFIMTFLHGAYVNDEYKIVMDKASEKISQMSKEIEEKTGVKLILNVLKKLPENQTITTFGEEYAQSLSGSFVVVSFSDMDMQVDLVTSSDLGDVIDKDKILDEYIIPFFVDKNKKTTIWQKYSAGLLNGMAEIADEIAGEKKITFNSSIGNESKNFIEGLTIIFKIMVLLTIFAVGYAYYRRKK